MRAGRPLGSRDFVAELEAKLERALPPRKLGPQPQTESDRVPGNKEVAAGAKFRG